MIRSGERKFLGMDDGLVDGRARGAQMRELRIDTIAPQHVDRRQRSRRALVGGRTLQNDPIDPADRALVRRIRHILEPAIDDCLNLIKSGLWLLAEIVPTALATTAIRPSSIALTPRFSDRGATILTCAPVT